MSNITNRQLDEAAQELKGMIRRYEAAHPLILPEMVLADVILSEEEKRVKQLARRVKRGASLSEIDCRERELEAFQQAFDMAMLEATLARRAGVRFQNSRPARASHDQALGKALSRERTYTASTPRQYRGETKSQAELEAEWKAQRRAAGLEAKSGVPEDKMTRNKIGEF